MMLDRYLIKHGKDVPLDGAVSYGVGWHTLDDLEYFNHNFYGIYNKGLIYPQKLLYLNTYLPQLKTLVKEETYNQMKEAVEKAKYLYQIDEAVHGRLQGYKNFAELYGNMVIRGLLKHIQIPTLHISAEDD
jgi:predicted alpha/beta-fold hydrolase